MNKKYQNVNNLKVSDELLSFVNDELLKETSISPEKFWQGFDNIVHELSPLNKKLIEKREILQKKIDDWHIKNRGAEIKIEEYKKFLKEIDYLKDEGSDFKIETNNVDDEIVIGSNATGKGTDTSFISANGGPIYAGNNSASLSTTSDRRIKKNIEDNNIGLDKINQIQVRNFEYRLPEEVDPELPQSAAIDKEGVQLGVIAQEAMEILPDIVKQESTGCYTVDPDNITWYLVNAVKELSAKVDELENNKCKCKE